MNRRGARVSLPQPKVPVQGFQSWRVGVVVKTSKLRRLALLALLRNAPSHECSLFIAPELERI